MPSKPKRRASNNEPAKETSWGGVAEWYSRLLSDAKAYQKTVVLPNLLRLLGPINNKTVADIACGPGFFSTQLRDAGAEVLAVDIAEELLAHARARDPRISWAVAPAHATGFPDASCDAAVIVLAIQNIENPPDVFKECFRILKPSGTLHIVMNHPAFRVPKRSSWGWDAAAKAQYRRVDGYLSESKERIEMHPGADKEAITVSFHRPLQYFLKSLGRAGFGVVAAEEWISDRASDSGPRAAAENAARKEIPLFMYLEARKL